MTANKKRRGRINNLTVLPSGINKENETAGRGCDLQSKNEMRGKDGDPLGNAERPKVNTITGRE